MDRSRIAARSPRLLLQTHCPSQVRAWSRWCGGANRSFTISGSRTAQTPKYTYTKVTQSYICICHQPTCKHTLQQAGTAARRYVGGVYVACRRARHLFSVVGVCCGPCIFALPLSYTYTALFLYNLNRSSSCPSRRSSPVASRRRTTAAMPSMKKRPSYLTLKVPSKVVHFASFRLKGGPLRA